MGFDAIGWVLRHAPQRIRAAGPAVGVGLVFLLGIAAVMAGSAPFVAGTDAEKVTLGLVAAALVMFVVLSTAVSVRGWPRWSSVALPVVGLLAQLAVGLLTTDVAIAFVGLIPLTFVYLGVFARPASALLTLPLALATYVATVGTVTGNSVIRLVLYGAALGTISTTLATLVAGHRRLTEVLENASQVDALTTLGNRRGLESRLATAEPGDCVVMCDLDLFKSINDAFGHAAGDEVLELFASTVGQHLRRRDYAARYGGEEFVLILPRTDAVQATAALAGLREEWLAAGSGVTFSAGVAEITAERATVAALAAADAALYRAKEGGRDRVCSAPRVATV